MGLTARSITRRSAAATLAVVVVVTALIVAIFTAGWLVAGDGGATTSQPTLPASPQASSLVTASPAAVATEAGSPTTAPVSLDVTFVALDLKASLERRWTGTVVKPVVAGPSAEVAASINAQIEAAIDADAVAMPHSFEGEPLNHLDLSSAVTYNGSDLLSIHISADFGYNHGTGHEGLNFDARTGRRILLGQLFSDEAGAMAILSNESNRLLDEQVPQPRNEYRLLTTEAAGRCFSDWTLSEDGLRVTFAYIDITGQLGGQNPTVVIPWTVLRSVIDPAGPAGVFLAGGVAPTPAAAGSVRWTPQSDFVQPADFTTPGVDPGVFWTRVTFSAAPESSPFAWGPVPSRWTGGWMASAQVGDGDSPWVVWLSATGLIWHAQSAPGWAFPAPAGFVAYDGRYAWTSSDGTEWERRSTVGLDAGSLSNTIGGSGGLLTMVAQTSWTSTTQWLAYSRDGIGWQYVSLPTVTGGFVGVPTIAWTGACFVATGVEWLAAGNTHWSAFRSLDGLNWTRAEVPADFSGGDLHVARDGVIVGHNTRWWSSPDGAIWSAVPASALPGLKANGVMPWLQSNGRMLLGQANDGRMWVSFDGRKWDLVAGSAPVIHGGDYVRGVVYLMPRGVYYGGREPLEYGESH